jgi:hypothetical protein
MNHFNEEHYNDTIKTLLSIKQVIADSNHDRMSVDPYSDYEPATEEVEGWLENTNLPAPAESKHSIVYELPKEYWTNIFGEVSSLSQEEELEVRNSKSYLELFNLYSSVYEDLYEAAKEESAYYANEFDEEQEYYNSMRGSI